jgi:TRAP transporter T-component
MRFVPLAVAAALSLTQAGCIKQMLLEGQIEATRKASAAVDTVSDYEVAQSAAFAGIAQFEGMHYLAPDNDDALFMLTKSWGGATFGFIEDMMEQAEDSEGTDSPYYLYQQARARAGYDRAFHYGIELLEHKKKGFEAAKKNDQTMQAWLQNFSKDDAEALFWTGYAWMSKTNVIKEDPAAVAELFVGVAMVERAVKLDDGVANASGHITLGAYHARSAMAELPEAKAELDRAIAITQGKNLLAKVQYAAKYYCIKGDKDAYVKTLTEVVQAGDVWPEHRLPNTIAKRRAQRYLQKPRLRACGF